MKLYATPVACPGCGRKMSVNNDGRLRWHGQRPGRWNFSPKCVGARIDARNFAKPKGVLV